MKHPKLTDEQQVVFDRWERDKLRLRQTIELLFKKSEYSPDEYKRLLNEIEADIVSQCEHERSIWKSCAACDEIEKIVYPELFDENGERKEDCDD